MNDSVLLKNSNVMYSADTDNAQDGVAHCGTVLFPHSCWKYIGNGPKFCYIQEAVYCDTDSDCDSRAPCYTPPE